MLGSSGSGGLEAAIVNAFSPGERVLACPVGVFGKRLVAIAKTNGLIVDVLETPLGHAVDPAALAARLADDGERTYAGVLLTHNETSTGVQNDMAALAAAIGDHPGARRRRFRERPRRVALYDGRVALRHRGHRVAKGARRAAGARDGRRSARAWERIERSETPRFYFDLAQGARIRDARPDAVDAAGVDRFRSRRRVARYHAAGAAHAYERHDRYARAIRAFARRPASRSFRARARIR